MAKSWTWTVEGNGAFPTDMLRYDACYPTDPESAQMVGHHVLGRAEPYTVRLRSHVGPPTVGRWNSFMFGVVDIQTQRG